MNSKVLIVDDKEANLTALHNIIAGPAVEVLNAQSAADALALLLDHEIALALIDVQMPEINGLELATLMRSAGRSRAVPIIFVTASEGEPQHVFEGYENGAVDYLIKPLDARIVRSKVRVFVELDQKTKALEQKLHEVDVLREAADAANRAKSLFLANMSHEIRTPLTAVLGFAQLLKLEAPSAAERRSAINAIERNGQLLLKLVNDVLDLSKIEADRIEVLKAPTPLAEIIAILRSVHSLRAVDKGLDLMITAAGRLPSRIHTDRLRLEQVLHNIVGNALKFTDQGYVKLTLSFEAKRHGGSLLFTVEDSGYGITEEQASQIFHAFIQAETAATHRLGGTGLGLTIAKQLATLLGGDVTLTRSKPGEGSTFLVSIDPGPVAEHDLVEGDILLHGQPSALTSGERPQAARLDQVRVLVADDAEDNRHLMSRLLALSGAVVETASDGDEAVEKAMTHRYDVILMDIRMPGTDGYEATARLRRLGYRQPIIALTAHAMKEDLARCQEAGCNYHLSKPVNHGKLVASVAEHVAQAAKLAALSTAETLN